MADPFYGEIRAFGFTYAPAGWAFCQGQNMPVAQNPALYSVIGNLYGGTPGQNFNLPDLRGRAPMGQGSGPGLTPRTVAQAVGTPTEKLLITQMPPHEHAIAVQTGNATASAPTGNFLAAAVTGGSRPSPKSAYAPEAPDAPLAPAALTPFQGGGQPHSNMQPYLALNLCICLQGEVYPVKP